MIDGRSQLKKDIQKSIRKDSTREKSHRKGKFYIKNHNFLPLTGLSTAISFQLGYWIMLCEPRQKNSKSII